MSYHFEMNTVTKNEICVVKSLRDIKFALKRLQIYTRNFSWFTGMCDPVTGEYNGIYFFSCEPQSSFDASPSEVPFTGKTLALFINKQYTEPSFTLYEKTSGKILGGWKIWSSIQNDECYVACQRILLGSSKMNS